MASGARPGVDARAAPSSGGGHRVRCGPRRWAGLSACSDLERPGTPSLTDPHRACPSWGGTRTARGRVALGIRVKETANHPLILGAVLAGFGLEEIDAALAQRHRHLHGLIAKNE